MEMESLILRFIEIKKERPLNVNRLLDFVQRCYINNELTLSQYRSLFYELTIRGAKKPEYFSNGYGVFKFQFSNDSLAETM